ncbi:unnamed protein product [Polarella glacialis]|uniref:Uncharacterized protein n=1 Tax=Polarella glacialis TaxID=89957 RepID=A0A813H9X8_POLGL|nr:unnamed protein product [Polarella glacialis]
MADDDTLAACRYQRKLPTRKPPRIENLRARTLNQPLAPIGTVWVRLALNSNLRDGSEKGRDKPPVPGQAVPEVLASSGEGEPAGRGTKHCRDGALQLLHVNCEAVNFPSHFFMRSRSWQRLPGDVYDVVEGLRQAGQLAAVEQPAADFQEADALASSWPARAMPPPRSASGSASSVRREEPPNFSAAHRAWQQSVSKEERLQSSAQLLRSGSGIQRLSDQLAGPSAGASEPLDVPWPMCRGSRVAAGGSSRGGKQEVLAPAANSAPAVPLVAAPAAAPAATSQLPAINAISSLSGAGRTSARPLSSASCGQLITTSGYGCQQRSSPSSEFGYCASNRSQVSRGGRSSSSSAGGLSGASTAASSQFSRNSVRGACGLLFFNNGRCNPHRSLDSATPSGRSSASTALTSISEASLKRELQQAVTAEVAKVVAPLQERLLSEHLARQRAESQLLEKIGTPLPPLPPATSGGCAAPPMVAAVP